MEKKIYRALGIDFVTYVVNMQLHEAGREARCKGNYHSSLVGTIVNSSHWNSMNSCDLIRIPKTYSRIHGFFSADHPSINLDQRILNSASMPSTTVREGSGGKYSRMWVMYTGIWLLNATFVIIVRTTLIPEMTRKGL